MGRHLLAIENSILLHQEKFLNTLIFEFFAHILDQIRILTNILKFSFAQLNDSVLCPFTQGRLPPFTHTIHFNQWIRGNTSLYCGGF